MYIVSLVTGTKNDLSKKYMKSAGRRVLATVAENRILFAYHGLRGIRPGFLHAICSVLLLAALAPAAEPSAPMQTLERFFSDLRQVKVFSCRIKRMQKIGDAALASKGVYRADSASAAYAFSVPGRFYFEICADSAVSMNMARRYGYVLRADSPRFDAACRMLDPLACLTGLPTDTLGWTYKGSSDTLLVFSSGDSRGRRCLSLSRDHGRPVAVERFSSDGACLEQALFSDFGLFKRDGLIPRSITIQRMVGRRKCIDSLYLTHASTKSVKRGGMSRVLSNLRLHAWPDSVGIAQ